MIINNLLMKILLIKIDLVIRKNIANLIPSINLKTELFIQDRNKLKEIDGLKYNNTVIKKITHLLIKDFIIILNIK